MKHMHSFQRVRELYRARHEPENFEAMALVYWYALLALSLIVVVASVAFGMWRFGQVMHAIDPSAIVAAPRPTAAIDRGALSEVLAELEARAIERQALGGSVPQVRDPLR